MDESEKSQTKVAERLAEFMPVADAETFIAAALRPKDVVSVLMAALAWDNVPLDTKTALVGSLAAIEPSSGEASAVEFVSPSEQHLTRLRSQGKQNLG